ncbi:Glycerophosphodiester phosphodiesterase gdpd2 [Stylosanthes scabra]|uniref:glycerophosphodiester phosphodiesterase n=1 Tax=Stylosanthes scabra TaxID=79078 RepID=A0ABU6RLX0_9FABA|nr:Glycerophosphodiester phosphodiesterase gdpd2 [Stylosanthes scabra]
MALKLLPLSHIVPSFDLTSENASTSRCSTHHSSTEVEMEQRRFEMGKFAVIGHRGSGMNDLQSLDHRMRAIKENSIVSFTSASNFALDFIEFDVQLTKDNCPVIFHDDLIFWEDNGDIFGEKVTELTLSQFLSYGPQRDSNKKGSKTLLRKTEDGKLVKWNVEQDDSLCTLHEAFVHVNPSLGFNIELKFDDYIVYEQGHLFHVLHSILKVVFENAKDRPIIFSTFQPDAAILVRKLQSTYPVFFLTEGGCELYEDVRRNSLQEALKLCTEHGLQGIVSEVKGIFRNPEAVREIKECCSNNNNNKLCLFTYGKLNNVPEAVYMQHLMGIDGVIVDFVKEISELVLDINDKGMEGKLQVKNNSNNLKPQFSQKELSFLFKLFPQLIQI